LKPDLRGQILRWATAGFFFCLVLLFLYLVGTAQSFLEPVLATLFALVKWSAWIGLVVAWFGLVPMAGRTRRLGPSLVLGVGFTVVFLFVLVWGSWVYPNSGLLP
jgi:hypothetical protein